MTVINRSYLLAAKPIVDMHGKKLTGPGGTSYGLGEAGYDIRIKQSIKFTSDGRRRIVVTREHEDDKAGDMVYGRFSLASAMEAFTMPPDLMGIVHDKSTWARRGLSVFNTVIEPGWNGFLTLELVYHGESELVIPAGSGIAQVIFHEVEEKAWYRGKYQNQGDEPVASIDSE
ncbi:dCTP deaminase [Pseudomonas phage phCDa]|uniref:dCTP deaminase n=1 Tax=Pseudomonas phage phCDa TaxID=2268587 RepID=A0A2Z5H977_9CAUD|nr:dCTP deaminase [Pseudomonas phage phCDa]AXC36524.1 putative dCTP deaminase [Pseudomonas phage phCDa]